MCGWLLIASQVPHGAAVFDPITFIRWDAGQYLGIASHGYHLSFHCLHGHPTRLPTPHMCTNTTWFAGYPLLTRAVSAAGISLPVAGLGITWVFWYLTLLMIWLLSEPAPERPASRWGMTARWLCLLIAAFFPGQIYFAALFPISMAAFGMLACCYWSTRVPNWPLAMIAGFIAGSAYLPSVAIIPGLVIATVMTKDRRARMATSLGVGGFAAGVGAVLGYAHFAVGRWDAYFFTERVGYGIGLHDPIAAIRGRFSSFLPLLESAAHRALAEQAFLVALLLVLALAGFAVGARAGFPASDIALIIAAVVVWLIPYIAIPYRPGAMMLSVYRDEALVIVLVPLLRWLPAWLLAPPLLAAAWVAAFMAPLFFSGYLV